MSNTPPVLPLPTARMAAKIDFAGGEANTAPATAAVSIPLPTNPACDGSWPLPPPEMSATFPAFITSSTSALTTTRWPLSSFRALLLVTKPSNASSTTFDGAFTSFLQAAIFHRTSDRVENGNHTKPAPGLRSTRAKRPRIRFSPSAQSIRWPFLSSALFVFCIH